MRLFLIQQDVKQSYHCRWDTKVRAFLHFVFAIERKRLTSEEGCLFCEAH
jgi:hypothetical protein